jgi:hypothetical protein
MDATPIVRMQKRIHTILSLTNQVLTADSMDSMDIFPFLLKKKKKKNMKCKTPLKAHSIHTIHTIVGKCLITLHKNSMDTVLHPYYCQGAS